MAERGKKTSVLNKIKWNTVCRRADGIFYGNQEKWQFLSENLCILRAKKGCNKKVFVLEC